nr:MAG TPA: hypothetical protein [Caudoviricetes sp.]
MDGQPLLLLFSVHVVYHISTARRCGKPALFLPPRQTAVLVVCHIWRDSVMAGGQCPCCAVQLRASQPKALNAERLTCRWKRNRRLGGRSAARNTAGQRRRKPKSLLVGSIPAPASKAQSRLSSFPLVVGGYSVVG